MGTGEDLAWRDGESSRGVATLITYTNVHVYLLAIYYLPCKCVCVCKNECIWNSSVIY